MIQYGENFDVVCYGSDKNSGAMLKDPYARMWKSYCWERGDKRTPIQYNHAKHQWESEEGVSIPYAVMDDYGELIGVSGPNE